MVHSFIIRIQLQLHHMVRIRVDLINALFVNSYHFLIYFKDLIVILHCCNPMGGLETMLNEVQ